MVIFTRLHLSMTPLPHRISPLSIRHSGVHPSFENCVILFIASWHSKTGSAEVLKSMSRVAFRVLRAEHGSYVVAVVTLFARLYDTVPTYAGACAIFMHKIDISYGIIVMHGGGSVLPDRVPSGSWTSIRPHRYGCRRRKSAAGAGVRSLAPK